MASLQDAGWRLTEEGVKICGGTAKGAMDLDLRDIGAECLSDEINRRLFQMLCACRATERAPIQSTYLRDTFYLKRLLLFYSCSCGSDWKP